MKTRLLSIALLAATLSAQTYDGNGALEAFYRQPKHHWYTSKKFWVPTLLIGSGVATGILASRSARPPIGRPAVAADVTPTFSVTRLGIGGPGILVTVVKGRAN